MPMRQLKRREAQVWLGQFNQHLMDWLSSSRTEEQHLRQAFFALRSIMEREPEAAEMVSNLCATLLHQHTQVLRPDLIDDMARLGLDAEQMRSDDHPLRWGERAILQLALARAANAQNRRFDALRALRPFHLPPYDDPSPAGCLRRYFDSKVHGELAELYEAGLDHLRAQSHARSAVEACDWLMTSEKNMGALLRGLTDLFYGDISLPDQVVKAVLQAMWYDLSRIEVHNAVRMTRCAIAADKAGASSPALTALAEQAVRRIGKRGVGGLTAVDLIVFFRQAPETLCRTIIEMVPAAATAVGVDRGSFDSLLPAAAAAYAECTPSVRQAYLESAAGLDNAEDPLIRAVGLGLLVVAESRTDGDEEPAHAEAFLRALDELVLRDDAATHDWRIRAEFDEPINVLVEVASSRLAQDADGAARIRLAHLLDSLRVAPSQALAWLASLSTRGTPPSLLERARRLANDLFGRLVFALRSWPKTVAIIVQATREKTLFVCVTDKGVEVFEGGEGFRNAAFAAAECVGEQMDLLCDLHVPPDDEAVKSVGRAGFEAFPAGVRKLMSENEVVLLCPDYRTDADAIPFEILYCDKEWLGIAKVVTRLPSLEAMVRAAEGSRRRVLERRLLSIAITRAEDHDPLPAAQAEAESVRTRLATVGWDAPLIHESRVDPEFILNRTPFAAHMHIAAHGEVGGVEEALVLSRGTRLTPENVIDGSYGCTPTLWLNTCALGQASYLGGGAVRGVAQAFVEAGAPAVIANLLPVDDRASSRLAERFYIHADEHDFGEALRRARRDLAGEGVSPVLWGSTVLMGDARVTLAPKSVAPAGWQNVLVQAVAQRDDPASLTALVATLERELRGNPDDLRLACGAEIVRALQAAVNSQHDDPAILAEVCRLCIRVHAMDAAAMAAYAISELKHDDDRLVALVITQGAIGLLRPVEAMNPGWSDLTNHLLLRAEQLRRGDRAFRVGVQSPEDADPTEIEKTRQIGQRLMEIKLAIDLRSRWYGLSPTPRQNEVSTEDILWNAVMASRTKSFEDMPETVAYARHIAEKVAGRGDLARERVALAVTMFAGLLKWMWDGQNLVAVEKEIIEGQTRVAQLALASLLANWSPEAPWMKQVCDYAKSIGKRLGALEQLPYDENLNVQISKAIKRIRDDGLARLQRVQAEFPDRVPDAITFLMGTLIETNTYSYTDGSIPEDICEKLKGVHHELSMRAEECLMPWLMEGFSAVRESTVDELQRWCYGIPIETARPA